MKSLIPTFLTSILLSWVGLIDRETGIQKHDHKGKRQEIENSQKKVEKTESFFTLDVNVN